MATELITRANKSVASLKTAYADDLHIRASVAHPGKMFFFCGDKKGYVSEKAVKLLERGCTDKDLQYAEVKRSDGTWIPTIMPAGGEDKYTL